MGGCKIALRKESIMGRNDEVTRSEVDGMISDAIFQYRKSMIDEDISCYLRNNLKITVDRGSNPDRAEFIISIYLDKYLFSQSRFII